MYACNCTLPVLSLQNVGHVRVRDKKEERDRAYLFAGDDQVMTEFF